MDAHNQFYISQAFFGRGERLRAPLFQDVAALRPPVKRIVDTDASNKLLCWRYFSVAERFCRRVETLSNKLRQFAD